MVVAHQEVGEGLEEVVDHLGDQLASVHSLRVEEVGQEEEEVHQEVAQRPVVAEDREVEVDHRVVVQHLEEGAGQAVGERFLGSEEREHLVLECLLEQVSA